MSGIIPSSSSHSWKKAGGMQELTYRQSGALSLVVIRLDTLLSLVELYYAGTKVYAITTHFMASKMSPTRGILCLSLCCYGMIS